MRSNEDRMIEVTMFILSIAVVALGIAIIYTIIYSN